MSIFVLERGCPAAAESRCWYLFGWLAPPRRGKLPHSPQGSKNRKWLLHTSCQHSFGSEDDKLLVPNGFWHWFWSQDNERVAPPFVGTAPVWAACPIAKKEPPTLHQDEKGSQVVTAFRLSAFVWKRR